MSGMSESELQAIFVRREALLKGHFKLSSGRHADQYFQCANLLCDPELAEKLGRSLAALLPKAWGRPETVVAPAMGGIVIGHETARALKTRSIFAERREGRMELRRGFTLESGEKIVVVEDVITTGKSTGEVISILKGLGAEVLGALSIVNRSAGKLSLGAPIASLAKLPAVSYDPVGCPLCAKKIPLIKPGSRPETQERTC